MDLAFVSDSTEKLSVVVVVGFTFLLSIFPLSDAQLGGFHSYIKKGFMESV